MNSHVPVWLIILVVLGYFLFRRAHFESRRLLMYVLIVVTLFALIEPYYLRLLLGEILYWINWLFWQLGVIPRHTPLIR